MLGSGMNLTTIVIGFGMSATFIVFVCTRLMCGRIRSLESRPVFELDAVTDLEQSEQRMNGLEPVVVAAIPTMKFNSDAFRFEDAQCSICLGEYQEKEVLRIMPKCSHNFHLSCIDVWLQKQSTCPVCRVPLQESIGEKNVRPPMFGTVLHSVDGPEIASDQWQLPGTVHSEGNGSIQGHHESVPGNLESTVAEEIETRS
ncbi:RING-H2 finger protein ATL39-like [Macadamia integrifolia]|uniref:RING-H2 finger protein ATL39-like n=1 Tax=Macadamia integrifolia TaxID=60698 RepID=UPI001C529506|nr:RING-H2 finger protein ATL39-like [Macadamia integrifolia]